MVILWMRIIKRYSNLLTNVMSERAEHHTKGQGNKVKYDVISERLFVEYKQLKNNQIIQHFQILRWLTNTNIFL